MGLLRFETHLLAGGFAHKNAGLQLHSFFPHGIHPQLWIPVETPDCRFVQAHASRYNDVPG
jgi:hypothetical protein